MAKKAIDSGECHKPTLGHKAGTGRYIMLLVQPKDNSHSHCGGFSSNLCTSEFDVFSNLREAGIASGMFLPTVLSTVMCLWSVLVLETDHSPGGSI